MELIVDENLISFNGLAQKIFDYFCCRFIWVPVICRKILRLVGLSTSVCGTGGISAHTATYSTNGSAHETQNLSTKLRKTNKVPEHRSGKCEFPALFSLSFCSFYADFNFSIYTILGNGINCRLPCFFCSDFTFF